MQNVAGEYYQRAPRCCPNRSAPDRIKLSNTGRGAELLCCCCSCSNSPSTKTPGFLASLGVCILVLGYTLLGAFAFMALEGGLKSVSESSFSSIVFPLPIPVSCLCVFFFAQCFCSFFFFLSFFLFSFPHQRTLSRVIFALKKKMYEIR